MEKGLLAAIRHFPQRGQDIRRLALADTNFRSLCDDLADAEAALDRWSQSASSEGDPRCDEYRVLVTELVSEIEHLIDAQEANR